MRKVIYVLILSVVFISCGKNVKLNSKNVYPKKSYGGVKELFDKYSCRIKSDKLVFELKAGFIADWDKLKGVINAGTKKEVNFGGKYVIIQWGCGTECQTGIIIDALTGKTARLPTSEWGIEYQKDSLLLIVNPPTKVVAVAKKPVYAYPAYYKWNGNRFDLLHDTRK